MVRNAIGVWIVLLLVIGGFILVQVQELEHSVNVHAQVGHVEKDTVNTSIKATNSVITMFNVQTEAGEIQIQENRILALKEEVVD